MPLPLLPIIVSRVLLALLPVATVGKIGIGYLVKKAVEEDKKHESNKIRRPSQERR